MQPFCLGESGMLGVILRRKRCSITLEVQSSIIGLYEICILRYFVNFLFSYL